MRIPASDTVKVVVPDSLEQTVIDFVDMLQSHPGFDIQTHDIHFFVCPRRRTKPVGFAVNEVRRSQDRK